MKMVCFENSFIICTFLHCSFHLQPENRVHRLKDSNGTLTRKKRSKDTSHEYCRWKRGPLPQQYLVINFAVCTIMFVANLIVIGIQLYFRGPCTACQIDLPLCARPGWGALSQPTPGTY